MSNSTSKTAIPEEEIDGVQEYWDQALDRLVQEHIEFDPVVEQITEYLEQLASLEEDR